MNHSNLKKKFQCYFEKLFKSKAVQLITSVRDYVHLNINACPLPDFVIDMLNIATYKSTSRVS